LGDDESSGVESHVLGQKVEKGERKLAEDACALGCVRPPARPRYQGHRQLAISSKAVEQMAFGLAPTDNGEPPTSHLERVDPGQGQYGRVRSSRSHQRQSAGRGQHPRELGLQPIELVPEMAGAQNSSGAILDLEQGKAGQAHGVAGVVEKVTPR